MTFPKFYSTTLDRENAKVIVPGGKNGHSYTIYEVRTLESIKVVRSIPVEDIAYNKDSKRGILVDGELNSATMAIRIDQLFTQMRACGINIVPFVVQEDTLRSANKKIEEAAIKLSADKIKIVKDNNNEIANRALFVQIKYIINYLLAIPDAGKRPEQSLLWTEVGIDQFVFGFNSNDTEHKWYMIDLEPIFGPNYLDRIYISNARRNRIVINDWIQEAEKSRRFTPAQIQELKSMIQ